MYKSVNKICFAFLALAVSCTTAEQKPVEKPVKELGIEKIINAAEMAERGKYLVNAMGCDDCHSPKKMGEHGPEIIEELRFSGYPSGRALQKMDKENLKLNWVLFNGDLTSAVGPWGQSFAANLTNDPTGIGNWTEENFITAIRKGKYKGMEAGRDLLPPMPWFAYRNLNDEDLKSIFAFLKTTRPVENVVPAPTSPANL